ncbi:hypothetical protein QQ045_013489 [Rhodiola kirilowii]
MYDLRALWIPVFFKDVSMGTLVRTTSRPESENSFFGRFLHSHMTLVEFYMGFDSAIDAQRYNRSKSDHKSRTSTLNLKCKLAIECHASEIFTIQVFKDIQVELAAAGFRAIQSMSGGENECTYTIKDAQHKDSMFKVTMGSSGKQLNCSCKKFETSGIICRHIFYVMNFLIWRL